MTAIRRLRESFGLLNSNFHVAYGLWSCSKRCNICQHCWLLQSWDYSALTTSLRYSISNEIYNNSSSLITAGRTSDVESKLVTW